MCLRQGRGFLGQNLLWEMRGFCQAGWAGLRAGNEDRRGKQGHSCFPACLKSSSSCCSLHRWELRHGHTGGLLGPAEHLGESDSCLYLQINFCSVFACTLQSVHGSGRKKTAESSQEGFQSRRFHGSSVLLVQTPRAQPHYSSSPSTKLRPLPLIRNKKSTILGFFSELLMIKEIVGNSL